MKKRYFSAAVMLAGSSAVEQTLAFCASAVNARLYAPEEIGLYLLVIAAESLFGSVLCLRYEAMIVTAAHRHEALVYGKAALLITCASSMLCGAGYGVICLAGRENAGWLAVLLSVMLLLRGVMNVLECMANRDRAYGSLCAARVVRVAGQGFGGVLLGVCGFGAWGLVVAHAAGLACGVFRQRDMMRRCERELRDVTPREMIAAIRKAYRQPLFATPAIFANRLSYNAVTLTVEGVYGGAALGFYGMANKALTLPMEIFGRSVARVFFREASAEYAKTGCFARAFRKASLLECGVSFVVGAACCALAPWAFETVYGEAWRFCGDIVRVFVPMLCVRMVTSSVAQGFQIAGRQRLELALHCLMAAAVIACGCLGRVMRWSLVSYLHTVSAALCTGYIFMYLCLARCAMGAR